jgi:hypothetical protein
MYQYQLPSILDGICTVRLKETLDTIVLEPDHKECAHNIVTAVLFNWTNTFIRVELPKKGE